MTFTLVWVKGLIRKRWGRLLGVAAGVAMTVAMLAALGAFISSAEWTMTGRAAADVPADWQIKLTSGTDVKAATETVQHTTDYKALSAVGYADTAGFAAHAGGTVQTTGPGKAIGLEESYRSKFPAEIRQLVGKEQGVLIAQQTSTNLHAGVGDNVTIQRIGLPPVEVTVEGIIDLPNADSFFQAIGVPATGMPQTPPDNVMIFPESLWHTLFDGQTAVHPDTIQTELHVRLSQQLPNNPADAFLYAKQLGKHVEAVLAGAGTVGNNLAARLDGARSDALYARVLFLFLGLPGALLAAFLTFAVAASGSQGRKQEHALLRTRGASWKHIMQLTIAEAFLTGGAGILMGGITVMGMGVIAPSFQIHWNVTSAVWFCAAALTGLMLALLSALLPAWYSSRNATVAAAKAAVGRQREPWWQAVYLDMVLLGGAAVSFLRSSSSGYQLILAPEGVAKTSVNYEAFIAPLFMWLGGALLFIRVWRFVLIKGRPGFTRLFRPLAGPLSHVVSLSLSRQREIVTRGILFVALSFSFAVSTGIFNATYNAQSLIDAQLTNGSDVTVQGSTAQPASDYAATLQNIPGASAVQAMQHRFAYVGNDLQDIYGIDPMQIENATSLSDSYFEGGSAKAMMTGLSGHEDGVLVSAETAKDYQLQPGDAIHLRLLSAADHQYHSVPFRFIGIVRKFPTAPTDSFLVANADYITKQTGMQGREIVLVKAQGKASEMAATVKNALAQTPALKVTDITQAQKTISSSLTSVSLNGLTTLELSFALLLCAGSTGLILALGLAERRRTMAILSALGAKQMQIGAFLWSEGLLMLIGGGAVGIGMGFGVAQLLVQVLKGVFDPPPQWLFIPWSYMLMLVGAATVSMLAAVLSARALARKQVIGMLRQL
ncbi:FtsX-like permease family protein [Paenibacillus alginolyticus]|uniref:FtsX-like permease family protein n=1 Tax=Paenibacillus alginolyticus TaxID=59839 RepID=A0ABT4GNN9_9BACL|nr:ABC transporter permease [Paenibacillus alginolyticus]MCY9667477.1 FtsX-like permease family protein [Paenibacillus alginolyticus]MCY9697623.1 FtsX-like permease family protein [Paenibacillus alginolyticus]MEC0144890.1 ABC transporter permease [Paenibacillus alginolyticus]